MPEMLRERRRAHPPRPRPVPDDSALNYQEVHLLLSSCYPPVILLLSPLITGGAVLLRPSRPISLRLRPAIDEAKHGMRLWQFSRRWCRRATPPFSAASSPAQMRGAAGPPRLPAASWHCVYDVAPPANDEHLAEGGGGEGRSLPVSGSAPRRHRAAGRGQRRVDLVRHRVEALAAWRMPGNSHPKAAALRRRLWKPGGALAALPGTVERRSGCGQDGFVTLARLGSGRRTGGGKRCPRVGFAAGPDLPQRGRNGKEYSISADLPTIICNNSIQLLSTIHHFCFRLFTRAAAH
jgi:hypothetical protein